MNQFAVRKQFYGNYVFNLLVTAIIFGPFLYSASSFASNRCEEVFRDVDKNDIATELSEYRSNISSHLKKSDIWPKIELGKSDAKFLSFSFVGKNRPDLRFTADQMSSKIAKQIVDFNLISSEPVIFEFARQLQEVIKRKLSQKEFKYVDLLEIAMPYARLEELIDGFKLSTSPDVATLKLMRERNSFPKSISRYQEVVKNGRSSSLVSPKPTGDDKTRENEVRLIELLSAAEPIFQFFPSFGAPATGRFVGLISRSGSYVGLPAKSLFHDNQFYSPLDFLEHDYGHNLRILESTLNSYLPQSKIMKIYNNKVSEKNWCAALVNFKRQLNKDEKSIQSARKLVEDRYQTIFNRIKMDLTERETIIAFQILFMSLHENGTIIGSSNFNLVRSTFFMEDRFLNPIIVAIQHDLKMYGEPPAKPEEMSAVARYLEDLAELRN